MIRVLLQKKTWKKIKRISNFLNSTTFLTSFSCPPVNPSTLASPANQELGPLEQKDFQELEPNQGETCGPVTGVTGMGPLRSRKQGKKIWEVGKIIFTQKFPRGDMGQFPVCQCLSNGIGNGGMFFSINGIHYGIFMGG